MRSFLLVFNNLTNVQKPWLREEYRTCSIFKSSCFQGKNFGDVHFFSSSRRDLTTITLVVGMDLFSNPLPALFWQVRSYETKKGKTNSYYSP